MKKSLFYSMLATTMLFATSCQQDEVFVDGNEAVVQFQISTPEMATRAYSDGTTATNLQYAVYDNNGNQIKALFPQSAEGYGEKEIKGSTTVELKLAQGNTYSVLFWAAAEGAPYTVDFGTHTLTVEYDGYSNDESRDAFYKWHTVTVNNNEIQKVELRRPFAQLNIGTGDMADAEAAGVEVKTTGVTVEGVYSTMNFKDGAVSDKVNVTFDRADIPSGETFPVAGYDYLAMNYVLVGTEKSVSNEVVLTYTGAASIESRTFTSIPLQRNYRTNIYGDLLTKGVDFIVEIKPAYNEPANNIDIWDGKTISKPEYDDATKTYTVSNAAELAWVAALVNGTLPTGMRAAEFAPAETLNGYTVKLDSDIDLYGNNGNVWTPIGNSTNQFQGTFDGDGHTIKNLVITGNKSDVGLFGMTTIGEIKNLTIENAKVSGRLDVGVVAGNPYTSKYTNITVKGHVEVNGMAYVGGVGGKNAYANWENITVDVDADSYVNANSVENGKAYRSYVGGVCGFNGEGGHSFTNITSNINVKGSTCDVGGLFGIAHYGNVFENCVCTGDVEIYAASEEADVQEIGGIAGVWHNQNGTQVTFTNCKFSGELKANDGFVINTKKFGNLVCSAYNSNGTGKLIIDGVEYMQTTEGIKITVDGVEAEVVTDYTTFADAISTPGAVVYLADGDYVLDGNRKLSIAKGVKIYGIGNRIKMEWSSLLFNEQTTLEDVTIVGVNFANNTILKMAYAKGNLYFKDCTFSHDRGNQSVHFDGHAGAKVVFENCAFYGRNMYASALETVEFKNCKFLESTWMTEQGNKGDAASWNGINMWGKYLFDNCEFDPACVCNVKTNDVVAEFINCKYTNGSDDIKNVVKNPSKYNCTITFDNVAVAATQEDMNAALEAGKDVVLSAGEYTFPKSFSAGATLVCEEGVVFTGSSSLNIKGATVIGATFSNAGGNAVGGTINGTFKDCTFTGSNALRYCYAGETTVFENCVFSGSLYGVHFDGGANDATFRNCTFSGFNAFGSALTMLTLEDCTFVGNGVSGYNGANLWGSTKMIGCEFTFDGTSQYEWIDCIGADKTYEFKNCTINGVDYTSENFDEYLNYIESRNDITVTINGEACEI